MGGKPTGLPRNTPSVFHGKPRRAGLPCFFCGAKSAGSQSSKRVDHDQNLITIERRNVGGAREGPETEAKSPNRAEPEREKGREQVNRVTLAFSLAPNT
ncbi:hypothetical protein IE53DRAFT_151738 [Violaceomyces palustris]|uniref:Uncharacterized protein n=1 Tax=Violaceomyces palustris TaxID=1673888 RepID=A0ACD0NTY6_9BASI|nr:hypothetical protein IE53DRAFT_151738 [Violaceomyces palustris]